MGMAQNLPKQWMTSWEDIKEILLMEEIPNNHLGCKKTL